MLQRSIRSATPWLCAGLFAVLAACSNSGAGGNGSSYTPAGLPGGQTFAAPATGADPDSAMPAFLPYAPRNQDGDAKGGSLPPVNTFPGAVIGRENAFHPSSGDYPKGGTGQTLDKIKCAKQMFINRYHIHFYLGVISNGKQVALPMAVGLVNPGTVTNGFVDTASCYYYLHTHDESGIVHVEVPRSAPFTKPLYKLGTLFKIWGINRSATQFAHFHGPVHVFVGNVPLKQVTVTNYAPLKGNLDDVEIYSHEVVWVEIGTTYYKSKHLPPVTFYMEY